MQIAVDLDGVLADTMVALCEILSTRHSTHVTVESFDRWEAWKVLGLTKIEFLRTLDEAWFHWETIPPTEENLAEKVERLKKFGKVDIVTGRSLITVPQANRWLRNHDIPFETFVRANSTTAKIKLNYDLFIDDSPPLMALVASTFDRAGILYLQPWNRYVSDMHRIFKVQRWADIPPIVERLSAQCP